jgi:hypothetical protein
MRDRRAINWDDDQILLGSIRRLPNGIRDLGCLAHPNPHASFAVTDDHHRAEREAATALDHFCHAVNLDDALFKLAATLVFIAAARRSIGPIATRCTATVVAILLHPVFPYLRRSPMTQGIRRAYLPASVVTLELQSLFAGSISNGLDTPVVEEPAPVVDDTSQPSCSGPLGNDFTNNASTLDFRRSFARSLLDLRLKITRGQQGMPFGIVYDLRVNMCR